MFLVLAHEGGWAYGFHAANWTLKVFIDPAYARVTSTYFQMRVWDSIIHGRICFTHLQWGALLVAFCAVAGWAARGWQKAQLAGTTGQGFLGLIMGMSFLVLFFTDWLAIGPALLVPTALAFLVTVGWCLRRAWQGRTATERRLGLAVVATAAMLMLARMLLNVRIYQYGFFHGRAGGVAGGAYFGL